MSQSVNDAFAAVDPVMNRSFYGGEEEVEKQAFDIFTVDSDDEPIKSAVEYAFPPNLELKTENDAVSQKSWRQGSIKTWRAVLHAAALTASYEAVSDVSNRYAKLVSAGGAMGRAVAITPELICALWLDNCFNATNPADPVGAASPDGLAVCSTAHLLPDGINTYSNAASTPSALDETSTEDIKTAYRTIVGPDTNIAPRKVRGWVVPAALNNKAQKLRINTKTSGSANNDPSVVNGTEVFPMDYLSSSTRYFALSDRKKDGPFWDWIKRPQFLTDQVVLNLQKVYVAFFRSRVGIKNCRELFGVNAT